MRRTPPPVQYDKFVCVLIPREDAVDITRRQQPERRQLYPTRPERPRHGDVTPPDSHETRR